MHTLNEQVRTFTEAEAAVTAEAIKQFLSEEFGWEIYGDNLYVDSSQTIGFHFKLATSTLAVNPINVGTEITSTTGVNINNVAVKVRYHVSAMENVIYVSVADNYAIIAAKDNNGNWYAFSNTAATVDGYSILSASANAGQKGSFPAITAADCYYTITKMPSIFDGGSFPELFGVVSVKAFDYINELISFNGTAYRIVALRSTGKPQFAFPVSD